MAYNWKSGRLQSGKLRHRIDIVKISPVQDSTGGWNPSVDTVYANVWASVEAMSGRETIVADSQTSVVSHQIVIRYIAGAPAWQADYEYAAARLIKDTNGNLQQAQGPGLSGNIVPTWNQVAGGLTFDGDPSTGLSWKNLGPAPPYTGVTAAMQVWFQGRQFQITSVQNPDERNKMLCLSCVEINDSRQQIPNGQPNGLN
jgi:head-tail adaptor